jgi:hypothetical protein
MDPERTAAMARAAGGGVNMNVGDRDCRDFANQVQCAKPALFALTDRSLSAGHVFADEVVDGKSRQSVRSAREHHRFGRDIEWRKHRNRRRGTRLAENNRFGRGSDIRARRLRSDRSSTAEAPRAARDSPE